MIYAIWSAKDDSTILIYNRIKQSIHDLWIAINMDYEIVRHINKYLSFSGSSLDAQYSIEHKQNNQFCPNKNNEAGKNVTYGFMKLWKH